mgnify:FL=1
MGWLELVGWIGSGLIVFSLMQARVLRFRWINFVGSLVATGYNTWIGIWPFAAMNAVIAAINIYWLIRLYREAKDAAVFEVVEVRPDDAYLGHVLRVHEADIAVFHPELTERRAQDAGAAPAQSAFVVARGDETVGVVLLRQEAEGVATVDLDWVTPRFRDFAVGDFVYRSSTLFADRGITHVVWPNPAKGTLEYLRRVGFAPAGDGAWSRAVGVA